MPTYEYVCESCEHTFEEFQSISADPLTECPKCKGRVKRLIGGGSGVLFKGTGFYQTDYRSSSYQKDAKKDAQKPGDAGKAKSDKPKGSQSKKASDA